MSHLHGIAMVTMMSYDINDNKNIIIIILLHQYTRSTFTEIVISHCDTFTEIVISHCDCFDSGIH